MERQGSGWSHLNIDAISTVRSKDLERHWCPLVPRLREQPVARNPHAARNAARESTYGGPAH
ncbi:hypothetical protein J2794_003833 [Paraburkholderia terricola]|nr:hypothetical protein [Paraburkholderia terricola]